MTKNKPRPFIGLLIFDMINQFIFGDGVVIYYLRTITAIFRVSGIFWILRLQSQLWFAQP